MIPKYLKLAGIPFILFISLFITIPSQSCEPDDCEKDTSSLVRKPNIYIHPEKDMELSLRILFPLGGEIVTSIPEYQDGWEISIDTSGLIDDSFEYLFYESRQPDLWQTEYGWIVGISDLESFFRNNLFAFGFMGSEIDDFIEYWIPRLQKSNLYAVYPQTIELIEKTIILDFSLNPDNLLRLFYLIKGINSDHNPITEPCISPFERKGFYVTEWGVILQ